MKLIPNLEYEKLVRNQAKSEIEKTLHLKSFHNKDRISSSVLNLHQLPDDIKLALFNTAAKGLHTQFQMISETPQNVKIVEDKQNLKQEQEQQVEIHKDAQHDNNESISTDIEELEDTEENVVDQRLRSMLPSSFREAAKFIMTSLRKTNDVGWLEGGEVSFHGQPRPGANILDLLSYVLRTTLRSTPPVGANTFLFVLKKLSIPQSIMGVRIRTLPKTSLGTLRARRTAVTPRNFGSPNDSFQSTSATTPRRIDWVNYS